MAKGNICKSTYLLFSIHTFLVFKQSKVTVDNILFSYSSHNWQKKLGKYSENACNYGCTITPKLSEAQFFFWSA